MGNFRVSCDSDFVHHHGRAIPRSHWTCVLAQSMVLLQFVPVREPATTAHRTARLGGLAAIIALLHALEDVEVTLASALAFS